MKIPKSDTLLKHSDIINDERFMDYVPSAKVALLAGISHCKTIDPIIRTSNLLGKQFAIQHNMLLPNGKYTMGYSVSPRVAVQVALQFNPHLRTKLLDKVADLDPDFYKSMLDSVATKPHDSRAWHKRIKYPLPTAEPTAADYVVMAAMCNSLKLKVAEIYERLVEAGLLRKSNRTKLGYQITALGADYIREYRRGSQCYFVYDKMPIIKIIKAIAVSKV